MEIKLWLLKELPEWAQEIPYQIKAIAIRDACLAVKAAKLKSIKTGQPQQVKFRSRKDPDQVVYVPSSAVKNGSVYRTLTGDLYASEPIEN